ncbi:MAG TPA: amidohydrolase family protein [Chitinophaga sp.]|uniref:amidohydrolase family protein n=1 Tax=Chitinophaga sp. TaxID=1869181 RepID=UPI002BF6BA0A|nr:amidohydrolase family protein [Chitinophaga sp.]HVI46589.1 amidohydrolase family protein [Chitinophaga sp.]
MRIITLEEHISFPALASLIPAETLAARSIERSPMIKRVAEELADVSNQRLVSMDKNGISMQVLSVIGAGAELLEPAAAKDFAALYNDTLAAAIAPYPFRFTAFAHLPMTSPEAAADELERACTQHGFCGAFINGLTQGSFLDDPQFAPVLQRAERLDVPIYLHPGLPLKAVVDAYYSGLPGNAGGVLATSGWGWHSETAIHILRLIISGTLDRYPRLKLIIGHMGEMLPGMMARCDQKFKPGQAGAHQRSISQTLREQVYITTSGMFTLPPLYMALETFGLNNILFSVDYPFSTNEEGKAMLDSFPLSHQEIVQIAHQNADRLLKLPR